jgi:hypothetical protein
VTVCAFAAPISGFPRTVGVIDERVQEGGHDQRVFEVVTLFENASPALLRAARAAPDVP